MGEDRRRRATLRDVARSAFVSVTTASNALRNQPGVATSTRQRVMRAAMNLGYQPNAAARALKVGGNTASRATRGNGPAA